MRTIPGFLPTALLAAVLIAGCGKDDPVTTQTDPEDQLYGSAQTDQQFFELYAANSEYFTIDDATMNDGDDPQSLDDLDVPKIMTGIHPLRWARSIRNVTRTAQLDSVTVDSLAYVTVTKSWQGVFVIAAAYSDTATAPDTVIRKPFASQAVKRFIFKRIGHGAVIWRNWRRVAVSMIKGGTTSNTDIALSQFKIRVDAGGFSDSVIVTDPLSTFFRLPQVPDLPAAHEVPDVPGGQQVTLEVTLQSTSPDTDHVALRYGFTADRQHRHRIRLRIVSETFNGTTYERVYRRTFAMHMRRGLFSAAIDAMTHGTLFDDAAPVSTSFWGVPYRVTQ